MGAGLVRLGHSSLEEFVAQFQYETVYFSSHHGIFYFTPGDGADGYYLLFPIHIRWFVTSFAASFRMAESASDADVYVLEVSTRYGWYSMSARSFKVLFRRLDYMALLADAAACELPEFDSVDEFDDLFRFVGACVDAIARGCKPLFVVSYGDPGFRSFLVDDVGGSSYVSTVDYAMSRRWHAVHYALVTTILRGGLQ